MTTVRLSNAMRDGIIDRAIDVSFKTRKDELTSRENSLALRCYNEATPASVLKSIEVFPDKDKYFKRCSELKFNAGGYQIKLRLDKPFVVRIDLGYYDVYHIIKDAGLSEEVRKYANDLETYKSERNKAQSALKALVYSFNTLKTLQDAWPEGNPFYKQYLDKNNVALPTVVFDDINKTLGLPIEAAA